ncbi:hypothetical protein H9P43_002660 [Blastocladiella emersonii ATCC 22665]|nr:hypothetical protein H9P43_002660 [Blastocladiella emersonii ATCC 22665]
MHVADLLTKVVALAASSDDLTCSAKDVSAAYIGHPAFHIIGGTAGLAELFPDILALVPGSKKVYQLLRTPAAVEEDPAFKSPHVILIDLYVHLYKNGPRKTFELYKDFAGHPALKANYIYWVALTKVAYDHFSVINPAAGAGKSDESSPKPKPGKGKDQVPYTICANKLKYTKRILGAPAASPQPAAAPSSPTPAPAPKTPSKSAAAAAGAAWTPSPTATPARASTPTPAPASARAKSPAPTTASAPSTPSGAPVPRKKPAAAATSSSPAIPWAPDAPALPTPTASASPSPSFPPPPPPPTRSHHKPARSDTSQYNPKTFYNTDGSTRCEALTFDGTPLHEVLAGILDVSAPTRIAVGAQGDLSRASYGDLAALVLAFTATTVGSATTPIAVLLDTRSTTAADREAARVAIKSVLENQDAPWELVVHGGRDLVDALDHHLDIQLAGAPLVDTQILFREWVEATRDAETLFGQLDALPEPLHAACAGLRREFAGVRAPTSRAETAVAADVNTVLAACRCPVDADAAVVEAALRTMDGCVDYWELGLPQDVLERHAVLSVDQLPAAAAVLEDKLAALAKWVRRAKSRVAGLERVQVAEWSTGPLPPRVPVLARFVVESATGNKVVQWHTMTEAEAAALPAGGTTALDPAVSASPKYAEWLETTRQEVHDLLALLPEPVRDAIYAIPDAVDTLNEISLDVGRPARLRFFGTTSNPTVDLTELGPVDEDMIESVVIGRTFSSDRRGGIDGQLHRISWIPNREGHAVGVTIRVGRAAAPGTGLAQLLGDVVHTGERSLLLLGKPGTGKTHTLRDVVARLSGPAGGHHHVLVVDTSNELGGPGDTPHASLGEARRMQVAVRADQHHVLLEAVQNHTPDVVVIDEISDKKEVDAARSVVTRIKAMVATAHGSVATVLRNRDMRNLLGGLHTSVVGDELAKKQGGRKTVTQRAEAAVFDVAVELVSRSEVRVVHDVNALVDAVLDFGAVPWVERRTLIGRRGEFRAVLEPFHDVQAQEMAGAM